jgi:hypothetical protein
MATRFLPGLIRISRFEELELAHTCCGQYWNGAPSPEMNGEEIFEIMGEEKKIIADLEKEMCEI